MIFSHKSLLFCREQTAKIFSAREKKTEFWPTPRKKFFLREIQKGHGATEKLWPVPVDQIQDKIESDRKD